MGSRRGTKASRVISLLTDFGTVDGYVGAMKGVILGLNPGATLVDITHEIPPQDVHDAAFVLHTVHRSFPPRTVHLAVVDPGVGTERAAVILDTGRALFVAPDNGLLSFVLAEGRGEGGHGDAETRGVTRASSVAGDAETPRVPVGAAGSRPAVQDWELGGQHSAPSTQNPELRVPIPEGWRAVRIAESRYWLPNPSKTFHGRDIFAPVAANLSLGEPVERFGPGMEMLQGFEVPVARRLPEGEIAGAVIHVDRFGNLITNLRAEELPQGAITTEVAGHRIEGLSQTYAGRRGLVALVGSSGYLEIALPGGSARDEIGAGVGIPVRVGRTV